MPLPENIFILFYWTAPEGCYFFIYCALYRNVTTWPRVQVAFGEKCVVLVPLVMPFATAHCTAL